MRCRQVLSLGNLPFVDTHGSAVAMMCRNWEALVSLGSIPAGGHFCRRVPLAPPFCAGGEAQSAYRMVGPKALAQLGKEVGGELGVMGMHRHLCR